MVEEPTRAPSDEPRAHVRLLRQLPTAPVPGCPAISAHQADDVFDVWQRWEAMTSERQGPPFWAVVWPGAAVLCQLLLESPDRVRGRRFVDLGCGSGVVAIAAARAGARTVLAIDDDPAAVDATQVNAALNGARVQAFVAEARLFEPEPGDVLALSEMFYDGSTALRLGELADGVVAAGGTVLVADGERKFLPVEKLRIVRHGVVTVNAELEGVAQRRVGVFEWVS